jgi:hypothetical protein
VRVDARLLAGVAIGESIAKGHHLRGIGEAGAPTSTCRARHKVSVRSSTRRFPDVVVDQHAFYGPGPSPRCKAQLADVTALHNDAAERGWDNEAARHARVIASIPGHLDRLNPGAHA